MELFSAPAEGNGDKVIEQSDRRKYGSIGGHTEF